MRTCTFTYKTIIDAPLDQVWSFFSNPNNLEKITTFPRVAIQFQSDTDEGKVIVMKLGIKGIGVTWISLIEEIQEGASFVDKAITLPFPLKQWIHRHEFIDQGDQTVMIDTLEYSASFPALLKPIIWSMFRGREHALQRFFPNLWI